MAELRELERKLEVSKKLQRRHSAPYLSATSELLGGAEGSWRGSRFWALGDDSDDDCFGTQSFQNEGGSEEEAYNSDKDLMRDATRLGFSVDDVLRAETMLTENFHSPKFMSVEKGPGHARHPQPLASRITEAVANVRLEKRKKPWKGPLPKSRSPQNWQLGDWMVKDLRISNQPETTKSLKDLYPIEAECFKGAVKEGESGKTGPVWMHRWPLGCPGAREPPLSIRHVAVGSHPAFTPTKGLTSLFIAGGKPRQLAAGSGGLRKIGPARRVLPPCSFAEIVRSGRKPARESESEKMTGNRGGYDREGRAAVGAYDPYRRDRGSVGMGRSWGGRESWTWRGGAAHDPFRGAQAGQSGGFGRGRSGLYSPPVGVGRGEWVWREDRRQSPVQDKNNGSGEIGEKEVKATGADIDLGISTENGGSKEEGEAVKLGGRCSRCSKKGHHAVACKTEVYCMICDSHEHINHKCPLLKAPRPVAHAAGYAVMGLGFYHIPHPPLPSLKKDSKMARVSVVGGTLTKDQLIMQLKRVVPVKWNWELREQEDGHFVTQFPSKVELQRSIAYGGADAKGEGVLEGTRLQFEEWHEKEEGFLLPKVWVRVRCIRESLREFPILWAVGSLLGSTQTVDMETTRKSDFGRIMVAVLDPKLIPRKLDVVIGDHYFDLEFEVEKRGFDENGDDADVEWDGGDGEGDGEGKRSDQSNGGSLNDDQSDDRINKRSKGVDGGAEGEAKKAGSHSELGGPSYGGHMLSEMEFNEFLKWKAEQVIDVVVEKALDDLATEVASESADALDENALAMATDWLVGSEAEGVAVEIKEISDADQQRKSEMESEKGAAIVGLGGCVLAPDGPADALVLEAARIPEVVQSPIRVNPRLAGMTAEHSLVRAERLVQSRNLESSRGYLQRDLLDTAMVPVV